MKLVLPTIFVYAYAQLYHYFIDGQVKTCFIYFYPHTEAWCSCYMT